MWWFCLRNNFSHPGLTFHIMVSLCIFWGFLSVMALFSYSILLWFYYCKLPFLVTSLPLREELSSGFLIWNVIFSNSFRKQNMIDYIEMDLIVFCCAFYADSDLALFLDLSISSNLWFHFLLVMWCYYICSFFVVCNRYDLSVPTDLWCKCLWFSWWLSAHWSITWYSWYSW